VSNGPAAVLNAGVVVEAWPMRWAGGRGFKLRDEPVDPRPRERFGPEYECRYLAVHGKTVVPITPWCALCNELQSGDELVYEVPLGWFSARLPLRVRFDLPQGGLQISARRDPAAEGQAVLEAEGGYIHWWAEDRDSPNFDLYPTDSVRRTFLYRSALGEVGDSISVTPSSIVTFGRVYAKCPKWVDPARLCPDGIDVEFKRVEFDVGGRWGYLDARGLELLGVVNPAREIHFRGPGHWRPGWSPRWRPPSP
jgi:hypothetical protein